MAFKAAKKVFLKISDNSRENTCARVSFLIKLQATDTLAQVFSCEFCEIFKNIFFCRTPPVASCGYSTLDLNIRKNSFACLFSVHNTISLSRHEQVCLMRLRFGR